MRLWDCELCPRLSISMGGRILSGGRNNGVGAGLLLSSTKPDERKSAHEGVVGLPRSLVLVWGADLSPCGALRFFPRAESTSSSRSPNEPNPRSSNRDHDESPRLVEALVVDAAD